MNFLRSHHIPKLALIVALHLFNLIGATVRDGAAGEAEGETVYLAAVLTPALAPCSTAPTLAWPTQGSNLDTIYPYFYYDAGDDRQATWVAFSLDEDPAFSSPVLQLYDRYPTGPKLVRLNANLEPATTYYWRTWLMCGEPGDPDAEVGPHSELGVFTTGSGGLIPDTPQLRAPVHGATVADDDVTLQWDAVAGAHDYWVKVIPEGSCIQNYWPSSNQMSVNLDAATPYSWSVQARSNYGLGARSEIWEFNTPE